MADAVADSGATYGILPFVEAGEKFVLGLDCIDIFENDSRVIGEEIVEHGPVRGGQSRIPAFEECASAARAGMVKARMTAIVNSNRVTFSS
jgi:hypothetical protein